MSLAIGLHDYRTPEPITVDQLRQELSYLVSRGEIEQSDADLRLEYYERYYGIGNAEKMYDLRRGIFPSDIIEQIANKRIEAERESAKRRKKANKSNRPRQPFLYRPIRALRQWWHDLKQSTAPVERLETVGMNSTSMRCDGCHTQVK